MRSFHALPLLLCLSVNQNLVINTETVVKVNEAQLDQRFQLKWFLVESEQSIYFQINAKTKGWVGIGFTKDHGMTNADIVTARTRNEMQCTDKGSCVRVEVPYVTDHFSTGERTPEFDRQQDYVLVSAGDNVNETQVTMKRLLDTGDPKDHKIQNETIELIWAMHTGDMTNANSSLPQHTSRGHVKLNLLDYQGMEHDSDTDSMSSSEAEDGHSASSETSESAESESSESESSMSSESSEPEPEAEG